MVLGSPVFACSYILALIHIHPSTLDHIDGSAVSPNQTLISMEFHLLLLLLEKKILFSVINLPPKVRCSAEIEVSFPKPNCNCKATVVANWFAGNGGNREIVGR